jgi:hypothetical protein
MEYNYTQLFSPTNTPHKINTKDPFVLSHLKEINLWLISIAKRRKLHLHTLIQGIDLYFYYLNKHRCDHKNIKALALVCIAICVKYHEGNDCISFRWTTREIWSLLDEEYSMNYIKRLEIHILDSIGWRISVFDDTYYHYYEQMRRLYLFLKPRTGIESVDKLLKQWDNIRNKLNLYLYEMCKLPILLTFEPYLRAQAVIYTVTNMVSPSLTTDDKEKVKNIIKILDKIDIINTDQVKPIYINY